MLIYCLADMMDDWEQSPLNIALNSDYLYGCLDDGCMDVALYLMSRGCGGDEHKAKLLCAACWWGKLGVVKQLVEQDKVDPKSEFDNLLCMLNTFRQIKG